MKKNSIYYKTKVRRHKIREIIKYFAKAFTAKDIASLSGISRQTVNRLINAIRLVVYEECQKQCPFIGDVEVDESYFGPRRQKGKRGREAVKKTIVFGVLERDGNVYTEIVDDCKKDTLQAIIRGKVDPSSIIHSDGWRGYNGLVDVGYNKHYRIKHSNNQFVNKKTHINGIESFWSFVKRRLAKFNGIHKNKFHLHLKESEFRFNHRGKNMYKIILKLLQ